LKQNLVFVPGLLCTGELFAPQVAALADVAGMTVADHTRQDTMAGIAASILAEAPERFALAGLSMGGYIALEMMRQAHERIDRLALLDTRARADTAELADRRRRLVEIARAGHFRKVTADHLMQVLIHPDRQGDAALTALITRMADDIGEDAFYRQQAAIIARPDCRPVLAGIRCPSVVIVGRQDAITPPDYAEEMAAAIPGCVLEIIEDCGHLSTLERPEAVNAALRRWLAA